MLRKLAVGIAAMLAAACISQPAPPDRAAPSPLCAVDVWDGFKQVRRFRLAPVTFGAERPRVGTELAAACASAKGEPFEIEGEETDVADGVWMALGYHTARIRRESSYLGYAIEKYPPKYEWRPTANAFDILGDITHIGATVSKAPECSKPTEVRCMEVDISSSGSVYAGRGTEKLSLVHEDQGWRLLKHEAYDSIILLHRPAG